VKKNKSFSYSDLHCHPNLKPFGHSFTLHNKAKQSLWFCAPPGFITRLINIKLGITRFSQADFRTMSRGGAKLIVVSLYPFEKGFFINSMGRGSISAFLCNLVTGIGYKRIRHLQNHTDYFHDLQKEYNFFLNSQKEHTDHQGTFRWHPAENLQEFEKIFNSKNEIAVLFSIEGAHVFNTGLGKFGRPLREDEVLENIRMVKRWKYPPFFITFAHNFYNDLCGHSSSLEPIRKFVNQSEGMSKGFTALGRQVLLDLLSSHNGKRILIDLKHMSVAARKEYFEIVSREFRDNIPPTIVSHGAVNGQSWKNFIPDADHPVFYPAEINFFDEEIVEIGRHAGLFAIQFDARRIARYKLVRKPIRSAFKKGEPITAVLMIWEQIKYIAELLDLHGYFGWGTACIGSDFDGTIDPLPEVWTASHFPSLEDGLKQQAHKYLNSNHPLTLPINKNISADEVIDRFFLINSVEFVRRNWL
jgi:Membrane dipeptidase (Peptidase family M19)